MGNRREVFRFLAPRLAQAGYRVVAADMRGHGESSMGWPSVTGTSAISRADVAGDLLALIRHAGGPAVIVGHSLSGGAATIAAAAEPGLVSGIVEINPFTRVQRLDVAPCCGSGDAARGSSGCWARSSSTACAGGCVTSTWPTQPSPPTTRSTWPGWRPSCQSRPGCQLCDRGLALRGWIVMVVASWILSLLLIAEFVMAPVNLRTGARCRCSSGSLAMRRQSRGGVFAPVKLASAALVAVGLAVPAAGVAGAAIVACVCALYLIRLSALGR